MSLNSDRLARLSGLISRDEYRNRALNESTQVVFEAEEETQEEEQSEESADAEESADTVEEAKLRQIIRREVSQIIDEVMASRDDKQLAHAQKSHNVGVAMGFSSPAFKPRSNTPNRATARGACGTKGFGGPGFM